jgi:hypothetical protein
VLLVPDQSMDSMGFREAFNRVRLVLVDPLIKSELMLVYKVPLRPLAMM